MMIVCWNQASAPPCCLDLRGPSAAALQLVVQAAWIESYHLSVRPLKLRPYIHRNSLRPLTSKAWKVTDVAYCAATTLHFWVHLFLPCSLKRSCLKHQACSFQPALVSPAQTKASHSRVSVCRAPVQWPSACHSPQGRNQWSWPRPKCSGLHQLGTTTPCRRRAAADKGNEREFKVCRYPGDVWSKLATHVLYSCVQKYHKHGY